MLSKGKQIALGIFTVIAFSVAAMLALGNVPIIDTYEFAQEKPISLCAVYVLYFAVFVLYAALAKRKKLEVLAKTTIIFGVVLAVGYLIMLGGALLDDSDSVLLKVGDVICILLYPVLLMAYPFCSSFSKMAQILGTVVLFAAPIIPGIIYLVTTWTGGKKKL